MAHIPRGILQYISSCIREEDVTYDEKQNLYNIHPGHKKFIRIVWDLVAEVLESPYIRHGLIRDIIDYYAIICSNTDRQEWSPDPHVFHHNPGCKQFSRNVHKALEDGISHANVLVNTSLYTFRYPCHLFAHIIPFYHRVTYPEERIATFPGKYLFFFLSNT